MQGWELLEECMSCELSHDKIKSFSGEQEKTNGRGDDAVEQAGERESC